MTLSLFRNPFWMADAGFFSAWGSAFCKNVNHLDLTQLRIRSTFYQMEISGILTIAYPRATRL